MILVYRHSGGNFSLKVFVWLGIGKLNSSFYSINDIALDLGEVYQALPFFHAYTGYDTVSSFFNHGKCKFWDRWFGFENESLLTKVFSELSQRPTNIAAEQTTHLEKYLLSVYYPHMTSISALNFQRMQDFEHSVHSHLRYLPPSKAGHIEHIKRTAFEADWVAYQCKENVDLPSPELWGRKLAENFLPKCQAIENPIDPERLATVTCSCIKAKCSRCQSSRLGIGCITFCKCQRQCQYAPM